MVEIKDKDGKTIYSTPINEGAVRKFTLMKEDYVIIPFSVDNPINFKHGCWIDNEFGLFEVVNITKPTYNSNTGGHDYKLRLDAHYWKWKNKIFKYTPENTGQEASWNLTATLDVQASIVLRNLKVLEYTYKGKEFTFSIDNSVENKSMLMSYDNINILDACFAMAKKWDCECWITENIIHFGKLEFGSPVNFEMGNNVEEMSRSDSKDTFATRIYAFGSTKNIPQNYRKSESDFVVNGVVQKRLMLPVDTPYIDAYPNMTTEEAVEQIIVFDDIYPKTECVVGKVASYSSTIKDETTENPDDTITETFYYVTDTSGFVFKKDYILKGEELKMQFQSGKLNGLEFGCVFRTKGEMLDGKKLGSDVYEIVANEDYGRKLPDSILLPEAGDKFILIGWDSTKLDTTNLISTAENELKKSAKNKVEKIKIDPSTYTCKMMSDSIYSSEGVHNLYEAGQKVNLINKAYFDNGRVSRIIGFEYKLDYPYDTPSYIVGETVAYSRIGELEDKIENITLNGQTYAGSNGNGVYVIGRYDNTPFTDRNVLSSLRSKGTFVSKNEDDIVHGLIKFIGGLDFGKLIRSLGAVDSFVSGKGTIITADGRIQTDRLEVRNSLKVLELLINKVRSVGGQICVSAANGKVRSVTEDGDDYRISFEQENIFRAHDLVRCRTFTEEKQDYWVEVKDANANGVVVAKSEFAGAIPRAGDECVLMGNTIDTDRQNMVLISATEDGQPMVDVLNGVNGKSFDGALRARLGNLDGINDEWFPADRQPRGDGLYADNAYLKGTFVLETGEDVKTRFEVTEGKVQSAIDSIRGDLAEESYLNNPTFSRGLEKWDSENETVFFRVGNMWVWANDGILSQSGDGASVVTDNGRTVVRIRNKYILQRNSNLRYIPNFPVNEDGTKEALPVYLSFFYRCRKAGTLRIRFENVDKTGFANFNSLDVTEAIGETDGYVQYSYSGKWNGTGDFRIDFDGDIYLCMLVLSTDKIDALTYKYRTLFEQSERLVKISAAVFDKDEQLLEETGIVTTSKMAGLYAIDGDGNLKSFVGAGQDGVKIKASNIQLEGLVTANENFKILEDGSIEAQNAKVKGYIYSIFKEINLSDAINLGYNSNTRNNEYKLKQNLYVDATFCGVVLPVSEEYEGARVIVMDSHIIKTKTAMPPTTIRAETGNVLSGLFYQDPESRYPNCLADVVEIDCGTVELILKNMANRNPLTGEIMSYSLQWVLVSSSCQHLSWEINGASFDYKYNLSY